MCVCVSVKISKSGRPYFFEFDADTCETSHTAFTPFTWHQILFEQKRWKGMPSVKRSISDISLDKTFSMGSPDLLTTGIHERVSRTVKCEY